jgi:hypothetical protein
MEARVRVGEKPSIYLTCVSPHILSKRRCNKTKALLETNQDINATQWFLMAYALQTTIFFLLLSACGVSFTEH